MQKVFKESGERNEFRPSRGTVCAEQQEQARICAPFQWQHCHRAVSSSPELMGDEQVTQGSFWGVLTEISKGKRPKMILDRKSEQ